MAISQAMCTSFKQELLIGNTHAFSAAGGSSFKMALYTSSATLGASTTSYTSSNEVTGTGYSAGGTALTNVDPSVSGTTAMATFSPNPSWSSATFTTRGALIYNTSASNKAVAVLDFGGDQTVSSGTFTVNMPTVSASTALLRLA